MAQKTMGNLAAEGSRSLLVVSLALSLGIITVARSQEALASEQRSADWPLYGQDHTERFYSPLTTINDHNAKDLGLAWFIDLPGQRTLAAAPLEVQGVLYFSGTYGATFAISARTGRKLWEFDPDSGRYRPDVFRFSGAMGAHRGVAYWRGKVYVGVLDGRLFALDAKTGRRIWSVQTFDDPNVHKTISGAPRVFKGKVIIGNTGDPGSRGYVTAYDAQTGQQRWRFYTVPGNPEKGFENSAMAMAAKTWQGEWWKSGGNGSVWDSIVYDPDFNCVYLATANWIPEKLGTDQRPNSDNLFVSSIVALDADTGKYRWHYQENPRGDLDYDSTNPMVLADLTIGGKPRKVLLHAPKNGFFYVIDRATRKLVSAEKITKATWAERIDLDSGRPVETQNVGETWPSYIGAHSWQPMSFNPSTRLVYIPMMKIGMRYGTNTDSLPKLVRKDPDDGTASLLAWDPVAQERRWEVRYADSFWNGGNLTTAGNLVFQGTGRGEFFAYNANTGEKLWSFYAGLGIIATPISYALDGVQYVSILVGYGGFGSILGQLTDYGWRFNEQPRRVLTFALGKHVSLPTTKPPRFTVQAVDDPATVIDMEQAAKGSVLYNSLGCTMCHGPRLENTGSFAPDLRESRLAASQEAFTSVLHNGALATMGMPKFGELRDEDIRAIYWYIRQRARDAASAQQSAVPTAPARAK